MSSVPSYLAEVIGDEIAAHRSNVRPQYESPDLIQLRFQRLESVVNSVFSALVDAQIGRVDPRRSVVSTSSITIHFARQPSDEVWLAVRIQPDGLTFYRFTPVSNQQFGSPPTLDLYWDPLNTKWFGPRLERDLSREGGPWIRERPEAVVTRAILAALDQTKG